MVRDQATFVALGVTYAAFMLIGAAIVRVPAVGCQPAGFVPGTNPLVTTGTVHVDQVLRTPQFYLLWLVLAEPSPPGSRC